MAHALVIESLLATRQIEATLSERNLQALLKLQTNPLYSYIQKVNLHLAGLFSMIDRLEQAALFMTSFSPSKRMRDAGITRKSHLQHSIEDYIIRTASIYDRALIAVNTICELGVASRRVDDKNVRRHSDKLSPIVIDSLDQLRATLEPYRQDRHAIVHREHYRDKELEILDGLELWVNCRALALDVELDEHTEFGVAFLPALIRGLARKKYHEFASVNREVCSRLVALFDALQPSYRARVASYQERGQGK